VVWQSVVHGQKLTFHLAGINNQNFIMRDEQTGSWWQQISGMAIQGAFKGQQLEAVPMDELSFAVWKRENPNGRVLRPDGNPEHVASQEWESQVGRMRVTTSAKQDDSLSPRDVVVGIVVDNQAGAYPFSSIEKQSPILDILGGRNIVVVLADDGESVRAFDREVDGQVLEFFVKPDTKEIVDAETGSTWDFTGSAISGDLAGKHLTKVPVIKDYWFDWKTYHPDTQLYKVGAR
jgi:hypothetical protein